MCICLCQRRENKHKVISLALMDVIFYSNKEINKMFIYFPRVSFYIYVRTFQELFLFKPFTLDNTSDIICFKFPFL